jgi:3-hydroxyacyl-CoA dehydrogenase/3a,7a,12a-trihydroxy-5b-cholest-24-enoyl-CoA hydratase
MRTKGVVVRKPNQPMTPEAVRDNWANITDFKEFTTPGNIAGEISNFTRLEGQWDMLILLEK